MPRKGKKTQRKIKRKRAGSSSMNGAGPLVAQMIAYRDQLTAQCHAMEAEIAAIGTALDAMGTVGGAPVGIPSVGARRGPRPAGASLKDYIERVVRSSREPVAVKNITKGVMASGYPTSSQNLTAQVSTALAEMIKHKRLKKVARGLYAI